MSTAGTIEWGTAVADTLYDSAGRPLSAGFRFTLGTFESGFTPAAGNTGLWDGNWKPIETGAFNAGLQYATETSHFTGTAANLIWQRDAEDPALPDSNPNTFHQGEQVYLWVYNSKTPSQSTEWALITGTGGTLNSYWNLSGDLAGDSAAIGPQWRLSSATTPVLGGLNSVDGPGQRSADPGTYSLQTAAVVPEPAAPALFLLSLLPLFRRRR